MSTRATLASRYADVIVRVGVNVQPRPDVALKLEVNTNRYDSPGDEDHEQVAASVALFF